MKKESATAGWLTVVMVWAGAVISPYAATASPWSVQVSTNPSGPWITLTNVNWSAGFARLQGPVGASVEIGNTVTNVPDYESASEYYIEGPKHIPRGPDRDAAVRERIKQEEEREEREYWAWLPHRYDPFDVADHDPTESQYGIKKPLAHGGGYTSLIKCEDERLNQILSMKAKLPIP